MTEEDWTVIENIDEETWRALFPSTRRAIKVLRDLREVDELASMRLRKRGDEPG